MTLPIPDKPAPLIKLFGETGPSQLLVATARDGLIGSANTGIAKPRDTTPGKKYAIVLQLAFMPFLITKK